MNKDGSNIKEILHILNARRSIRKFKPDPIPRSILMELLKYATYAPSATNRQAWRFIIVNDSALRNKIVDAGGSILINKAPCGILVTYENTTRNIRYRDDIQSAAACIQNLLLAVKAFGLGACWICTLPPKPFLRKLFKIPSNFSPIAYILLGYPTNKTLKHVARKNLLDHIVAVNRFPNQALTKPKSKLGLYIERFLVWVYDILPICLKKSFVNKIVDKTFTKKFEN